MNKCIHCEGTGKAACKTCNGEGKVTCSRCGGSGREMSICPTCTKGKVADPRSFDDEPTLVCPDCHGEWQKDVGPCKACNGTGKKSCEFCKGSGKEICELCEGTGSVDIESMCKSVIDVAEEIGEYDSNRWNVCINKITSDMAAAIFDAANRGVGIAAYVASTLCADYEELAGGEDAYDKYHTTAIASNNKIALYMYWVGGIIECGGMEEDIITDIKKSAEQGYVPALALLAGHYYDCGDDGEVCTADWSKALECWKSRTAC